MHLRCRQRTTSTVPHVLLPHSNRLFRHALKKRERRQRCRHLRSLPLRSQKKQRLLQKARRALVPEHDPHVHLLSAMLVVNPTPDQQRPLSPLSMGKGKARLLQHRRSNIAPSVGVHPRPHHRRHLQRKNRNPRRLILKNLSAMFAANYVPSS